METPLYSRELGCPVHLVMLLGKILFAHMQKKLD